MKHRYILLYCLLSLLAQPVCAQNPIEFVENQGQWGTWFQFKAETPSGDVCLEKDGFRYILSDQDNFYKMDYYHHGQTKEKPTLKFHVYKMSFIGAQTQKITGLRPQQVYYNYFLGNEPEKWKTGIHPCKGVLYNDLYKGIDLQIGSEQGNIVYDFYVNPGADAGQVQLKFEGQDDLKLRNHNLQITTTVGQITELKPYAFQYIDNEKVEVPCEYHLKKNVVTFEFPKGYSRAHKLIIDPTVVLCTMTGSTADNWGFTATFDDTGNFYAGGLVNCLAYAGSTFPVSVGAFQTTFGGGLTYVDASTGQLWAYAADISIIKYDPSLRNRIYATYLGGRGNDHAHSMIVDPAGNLIIDGRTISNNYPVSSGAYQATNRGQWDIVVTKLNSTCTGLIGSTYIGGTLDDGVNYDSTEYGYGELKYNYGDDARSEVLIDKAGNIYVAGCTNATDFPTTSTAISSTLSGLQDGVVFKMNPTLTTLLWSTYITGNRSDAAYVLAFDTLQRSVYVAGGTNSSTFPTTSGTLWPAYQGGLADGFVMKFQNFPPYALQRGTYIGRSNYDQVYGIQVSSASNEVYVMGQSLGGTFPVSSGVYRNLGSSQFIMKLDSNLTTNLLSTVFGSGSSAFTNISPTAFLVDTCENVYVSGWGGNLGIPGIASGECHGMPITSDASQPTTDGRDFYFIVLGPGMTTLRYGSYYGRNCTVPFEGEHVDGGTSRFSKHGIIYQGICANCGGVYHPVTNPGACRSPFPTTPGVWSEIDSSRNCNQAALKINFNIGPVEAVIVAGPNTNGCAPLVVRFTNLSNNGLSFLWDFGDGSPLDTAYSPTHTFTLAGTFRVRLTAANSTACFVTDDTAYFTIVVDTNRIIPGFDYVITDSCDPYRATFTNTSVDLAGGVPTYIWHFGDGTTYTGTTPPIHSYSGTGTYTVMLIMSDPLACKTPDTITKVLRINSFRVSASFSMPDSLCLGTVFTLTPVTVNGATYFWRFSTGDSSTAASTTHKFDVPGTYTVTFTVANNLSCNGADTVIRTIKILPAPFANFNYAPSPPIPNTPVSFTNLSVKATRYVWDFGDNSGSTVVDPVHQYNKTGTYTVCLDAFNASECPSRMCKPVATEVIPIVDLPTGFSPNGDGQNDVLYVRGAAIKTMSLKIYNRWGQLIFESNSQDKGWDGTFNGQPQPLEAYGYVLNITFIDGTAKLMKGNITLLR